MRRAALVLLPVGGRWRERLMACAGRFAAKGSALLAAIIAMVAVLGIALAAAPRTHPRAAPTPGSPSLPVRAWGPVSRALGRGNPTYRAARSGAGFVARNSGQRLLARFSATGSTVLSGRARVGIRVRGYGYGNTIQAAAAVLPTASANRVLYRDGSLTEWFANGPVGLEQGFTLSARPTGRRSGPLTIVLGISGDTRARLSRGGDAVSFSRGATTLSYRGLVATDAQGRALRSWLQLRGRDLLLRVRDTGAHYPLRIDPFIQQAELIASDAADGNELGYSAAIQGNTIVAGAPFETVNGNFGQGAAYVFVKPAGGWQNATETAKLTTSDGVTNDNFGSSVAIDGNTIVAGATNATVNGNAYQGAMYLFLRPRGGWSSETQAAKLTASDGAAIDSLGWSVVTSGNIIVAGAPGATVNGNPYRGAVYVFRQPRGGWSSETQAAKLTASGGGADDNLGWSMAIDGNTIVAGAPFATVNANPDQGAAYVFRQPRGGWSSETQAAKLTASDGASNDNLGTSVAIDPNTIVAGAPDATVNGNPYQGAAYVFLPSRSGWQSETEAAKLTASDATCRGLGSAVAVQGNTVLAGAPFSTVAVVNGNGEQGKTYVFDRPKPGWTTETQTATLVPTNLGTAGGLGYALAIQGNTIVDGAPLTTENANLNSFEGAVFVFG